MRIAMEMWLCLRPYNRNTSPCNQTRSKVLGSKKNSLHIHLCDVCGASHGSSASSSWGPAPHRVRDDPRSTSVAIQVKDGPDAAYPFRAAGPSEEGPSGEAVEGNELGQKEPQRDHPSHLGKKWTQKEVISICFDLSWKKCNCQLL